MRSLELFKKLQSRYIGANGKRTREEFPRTEGARGTYPRKLSTVRVAGGVYAMRWYLETLTGVIDLITTSSSYMAVVYIEYRFLRVVVIWGKWWSTGLSKM